MANLDELRKSLLIGRWFKIMVGDTAVDGEIMEQYLDNTVDIRTSLGTYRRALSELFN